MGDRPWHKRYHGNAISGYMGLTLEERGAYSTLLDYLYDRRAPLPNNVRMIAGYLDVSVRKASAVIDSLLQQGKLYRREDGTLSNRRFEKEVENDAKTTDHMAEIGSKGGRRSAELKKKTNKNSGAKQRALKPRSSYLEPELEPEERKKESNKYPSVKPTGKAVKASLPEDFPHTEAKAAAVLFWQNKGRPDLAAAVADQAAQFRDHHAARGGKMVDWAAAWRTWVRNALEFTRPPAGRPQPIPKPAEADLDTWVRRLVYFYEGDESEGIEAGYWPAKLGPMPGAPGYLVPKAAMDAYAARRRPGGAQGAL